MSSLVCTWVPEIAVVAKKGYTSFTSCSGARGKDMTACCCHRSERGVEEALSKVGGAERDC